MPHLVRVYIKQVIIGYAISAAFVAGLLYANVANLWHLVTHVDVGWIAVLMLWVFNGIVFAGVQFALALPADHGDGPSGGHRGRIPLRLAQLVPIPVETDRRRR